MIKSLTKSEFKKTKRELLLDYDIYAEWVEETTADIEIIGMALAQPPEKLTRVPLGELRLSLKQRATSTLDHLAVMYSAGHDPAELRAFFPQVVQYWKEYAEISTAFDKSHEGSIAKVANIALLGTDFVYANMLIAFALLLGWEQLLKQISTIIDFNNPVRDGMLERILQRYVDGRDTPPDECTRHLPYYKTLKIFGASSERRVEMMAEYLEAWYEASRREVYYDSHTRGPVFTGYWAWEAAAITFALDIDDARYANAPFYPADLVRFGREVANRYAVEGYPNARPNELRTKAGETCPRTGLWEALGTEGSARTCIEGEPMPNLESAYGLTVWRMQTS